MTARRLEHATGITSTSLTRLLNAARRPDPGTSQTVGLARGGVLVVDEASMVDTRTLAALLAHTRAAQATLVLVGDPAQLSEVGAGGLFTALTRHPDTITLTDNRRQTAAWERRALADLRAGDPDAAVAAYAEHHRVHTAPAHELADHVVQDYLRHLDNTGLQRPSGSKAAAASERVVMLAVRRVDVAELNDTARARLLTTGRLGSEAITAGYGQQAREYRAGDQVLVTANDHHLGLLNGTRATVTSVYPQHSKIVLAAEDGQRVTVRADWAERHLDHGYAMTCHKAQGATVDVALLCGTAALTREAGYVALSRGRTANHLYVADDTVERGIASEDGHLDQLATRLSQRRTQTLATLQLPRSQPRPVADQPPCRSRSAPSRRDHPMSSQTIETRVRPLERVGGSSAAVATDPLAGLPPVIDLVHAAALLGLGWTTAYKLVRTGQWPTPVLRIGRLIKVPTAPLRDLLTCSTPRAAPLPVAPGE